MSFGVDDEVPEAIR